MRTTLRCLCPACTLWAYAKDRISTPGRPEVCENCDGKCRVIDDRRIVICTACKGTGKVFK